MLLCREPRIASTLVGMPTTAMVHANVTAALQALGIEPSPHASKEAAVLQEVQRILAPVKDVSWPSGRQDSS